MIGSKPTYLSLTSLVCSEISSVTTQLRLDARASVSYLGSSAIIPRLQRSFKKVREVALHYGPGRDCMEYLEPFLETIRCEETSGVVTQRALSAVHSFLRAELLSLNPSSAPAAMAAVVRAATFCRFEVTDPAADEVVLMCILQLLVCCIECNAGALLSDESVCEVVHSCFRISSQSSLSELLRHSAESGLRRIVHVLFSRVHALPKDSALAAALDQAAPPIVTMALPHDGGASMADEVAAAADSAKAQAEAEAEVRKQASAAAAAATPEAGGEAGSVASDEVGEAPGGVARPVEETQPPSSPASPTTPGPPPVDGASAEEAFTMGAADAADSMLPPEPSLVLTPKPSLLGREGSQVRSQTAEGGEGAKTSEVPTPHGVGCLYEVLRFLVLLVDPNEPQNPQAVREFGLSLLHVALQAGGPALASVPALSTLLSNELALGLIMNAEAAGGGAAAASGSASGDESSVVPPAELLSLVLMCCYQLFLVLGVRGTLQEETLLHRVYLKLLDNKALMEGREQRDARETLMEMLLQLCELPQLPLRLYTHFDCDLRRTDLLEDLCKALSRAALPAAGPPEAAHVLAVEALLAILRATCAPEQPPAAAAAAAADVTTNAASAAALGGAEAEATERVGAIRAAAAQASKSKESKRLIGRIAEAFNTKPKHGIKALEESGLLALPLQPKQLAAFARETVQLDKAVLGEYLADPADFNAKVLKAFVALQDFATLSIDSALRIFLQSFRLPGEAQKIDRMMEAFASAFFAANPGPFEHPDGAYVLAFSIVMLNTDLHSPNITKRMSVEDFVRNNRGINNGKNLPEELLHDVFTAIAEDEIKMLGGKEELILSASGWRHIISQGEAQRRWSGVVPPPELGSASGTSLELELLRTQWQPTLAAIAALIEASAERGLLARALHGFVVCARVAAQCSAPDELDALVAQLARLSSLLAPPALADLPRLGEPLPPPPTERPFAAQPKAMLAASSLCRVAREHGHALRAGWAPVVQAVVGLHDRRLLPPALASADSFVGPSAAGAAAALGDEAAPTPPSVAASERKSGFSFFGGLAYLIGAGAEAEADGARLRAEAEARKEVAAFGLVELFEETAFLPPAALVALTDALLHAMLSPLATAGAGGTVVCAADHPAATAGSAAAAGTTSVVVEAAAAPPATTCKATELTPTAAAAAAAAAAGGAAAPNRAGDAARAARRPVLLLQLLVEVALRNRDRFDMLWPQLRVAFVAAFQGHSTRPTLVQPAAVALLRLCVRLAHRDGLLDAVLPALEPALDVELDVGARRALAEQTTAGVLLLLQSGTAPQISLARSWRVLLGLASGRLIEGATTSAIACGFDALGVIVRAPACVTPANFASLLDALVWHAGCPAAPLASCVQAIDLLFALHTRLQALLPALSNSPRSDGLLDEFAAAVRGHAPPAGSEVHARLWAGLRPAVDLPVPAAATAPASADAGEGTSRGSEDTWLQLWLPVLRALCLLCFDGRAAVRDAAVVTLQRALLDMELRTLPAATWGQCIDAVVFPFLAELLARCTPEDGLQDEGLMRRAITLMSKAFLQHLEALLSLSHFVRLWLRALELLEQYMRSPGNELLQEAVPETLKNMLLVMGASGAFSSGSSTEFLDLTRTVVGDFCPPMRNAAELALQSLQPPAPPVAEYGEHGAQEQASDVLLGSPDGAASGATQSTGGVQAADLGRADENAAEKPPPETPPLAVASSWFGYFSGGSP